MWTSSTTCKMGRKLYIELDVDWEDYDDVSDELMLEDIFDGVFVKDGVLMVVV